MLRIATAGIKAILIILTAIGLISCFVEAVRGQRTMSERYQAPSIATAQEDPAKYDRDWQNILDKMSQRMDEIERNSQ